MKNLLLFLLLGFTNGLLAQSPDFSLYVGPSYGIYSAENSFQESNRLLIADSTGTVLVATLAEVSYKFTNQPGANIHGSIHFPINDEFRFVTGLQLSWSGFKIEPINVGFVDIPNPDTSFFPFTPIIESSNVPSCIFVENKGPFDVDRRIDHQMIYLSIPLNVEFKLGEPFSVQAGGYLSTPLYTRVREETLNVVRGDEIMIFGGEDPFVECDLQEVTNTYTSGNNFNNLLLGINLNANYRITNNIEVSMHFSKTLNNIFSVDNDVTNSFVRPHLRANIDAYQASIGIRYLFGKNEIKQEE